MRLRAVLAALLLPATAAAQDSAFIASFPWRSVGPANMSGRVSDVEANHLNPKVIYAAFATGGIWKTVNAGTTWTPVFDRTGVHSTSELAIAPSDTSVIWVGTGEEDSRNSISPGEGVFKSTDAGRTWTPMGLRETSHIGRIVIHPTNPDIVFVAALGRAWGPNRERGLYKTTDGGRTWRLVQFVSEHAGFVEVAIDPRDPNIVWATSWERQRGPYFLRSGGPGSGLWKSTDGGETFARVTGNGLPTTTLGRIGLAIAPSNGQYIYALFEADSSPNPASLRRGFVPDSTRRQRLESGLFRSTDGGASWERMNRDNNRPFYYSHLKVDPSNPDRVYWLSTQIRFSNDGGRTWRTVGAGIHVDYHAIWINPGDPEHYIVGQDGGLAQTFDRGRTYDAILQMAVGQFYAIGVDMQRPFWICGGLQDNGEWCGPSQTPREGIRNSDWFMVNGGDGFYAAIDPTNPDLIFVESQGGNISRLNLRTWERRNIRPGGGFGATRLLEDSILIARGDTAVPATPDINRIMDSLRTRITRDTAVLTRNRFNWSAPFFLSPHNPRTLYMGGHRVWKSVNQGDQWLPISDDLSLRDTARLRLSMARTGGITLDATGAETYGTITTLSESPVRPGILWAGTDDGNVWLTRNDGAAWENLTGRFPGVPRSTYVSRVDASSFDSGTVYVTFDGHRGDDFRPYAFISTDFGRTFRPIVSGIPANEYVHVITDNPRRRGLLFLGTEKTAYVSVDNGESWRPFNNALPPAPVHDLVVHPRDRVVVAGTHGRSIWTAEIGALEQAVDSVMHKPVHVFAPEVALLFTARVAGGGVGAVGWKLFTAPNPGFGARIPIRIQGPPDAVARGADSAQGEAGAPGGGPGGPGGPGGQARRGDTVLVAILDVAGDTVRTLRTSASGSPLRYINWDLRRSRAPLSISQLRDSVRNAARQQFVRDSIQAANRDSTARRSQPPQRDPTPHEPGTYNAPPGAGGGGGGGGQGFGGNAGPFVEPGVYAVVIRLNGQEYRTTVRVERATQSSALSGGWQ